MVTIVLAIRYRPHFHDAGEMSKRLARGVL